MARVPNGELSKVRKLGEVIKYTKPDGEVFLLSVLDTKAAISEIVGDEIKEKLAEYLDDKESKFLDLIATDAESMYKKLYNYVQDRLTNLTQQIIELTMTSYFEKEVERRVAQKLKEKGRF